MSCTFLYVAYNLVLTLQIGTSKKLWLNVGGIIGQHAEALFGY